MEWMTALMDKMYTKLDQKKHLINPRYIKKEIEGRVGKILDRVIIGEEIGHLVQNVAVIITEDMKEVELILEEVAFEAGLVIILDETVVGIEIERIEGHGDSLDQEKEKGELGLNQVLDQVQELAQIGTESDVSNVGNMNILQMNVQI